MLKVKIKNPIPICSENDVPVLPCIYQGTSTREDHKVLIITVWSPKETLDLLGKRGASPQRKFHLSAHISSFVT